MTNLVENQRTEIESRFKMKLLKKHNLYKNLKTNSISYCDAAKMMSEGPGLHFLSEKWRARLTRQDQCPALLPKT